MNGEITKHVVDGIEIEIRDADQGGLRSAFVFRVNGSLVRAIPGHGGCPFAAIDSETMLNFIAAKVRKAFAK